jgi:nitrate reductase (NAD(P)H)
MPDVDYQRIEYDWDEIKRHVTLNDCWIVIKNKVYDITPFLNKHPGGFRILLSNAGTNCTVLFSNHSSRAKTMLAEYHIGFVEGETDELCNIV